MNAKPPGAPEPPEAPPPGDLPAAPGHQSAGPGRGRETRALDRLLARTATGAVARGAAFTLDFAAALLRAARGRPEHPEERVVD